MTEWTKRYESDVQAVEWADKRTIKWSVVENGVDKENSIVIWRLDCWICAGLWRGQNLWWNFLYNGFVDYSLHGRKFKVVGCSVWNFMNGDGADLRLFCRLLMFEKNSVITCRISKAVLWAGRGGKAALDDFLVWQLVGGKRWFLECFWACLWGFSD